MLRSLILTRDHGEGWSVDEDRWIEKQDEEIKKYTDRKRERKAATKEHECLRYSSEENDPLTGQP